MQDKMKELLSIRDGDLSIEEARVLGIALTSVQKEVFNLEEQSRID